MSDVSLPEANFRSLLHNYYTKTKAPDAIELISGYIRDHQRYYLKTLFRDHRVLGNSVPEGLEADGRAAFDKLLKCCSAMEIAAQAGFIPPWATASPLQMDWGLLVQPVLEQDLARQYYESYYPEKNPQLFRYRLRGFSARSEHGAEVDETDLIRRFLNLDARFIDFLEDGPGQQFLMLLDDWSEYDPVSGRSYRFEDIFSDPRKFISVFLEPINKDDPLSSGVHGFVFFLSFSVKLIKILELASERPLLQSAIWNHYGYWYNLLQPRLKDELAEDIDQFLSWPPVLKRIQEDSGGGELDINALDTEIKTYVDTSHRVIDTLCARSYSERVDQELLRLAAACPEGS